MKKEDLASMRDVENKAHYRLEVCGGLDEANGGFEQVD